MTVNIHPLDQPTCSSSGCGVWAELAVVVEASDPGQLTATLVLCQDHASSLVVNSEEARELLLAAQEVLYVSPEDSPEEVELRNRIRSYLDLD